MRSPIWNPCRALLAMVFFATACGSPSPSGHLIVLAIDGLDPDVIGLLSEEGKLPNFSLLRKQGAYGRLRSQPPLLSPIIWTTIATGKPADEHGIGHFVAVNEKTGRQLPVTSQMRRVRALWNIFSDSGRSVDVVGWWATWPAETVKGTIVSDHAGYHFLLEEGAQGGKDSIGIVYPPDRSDELLSLMRRPASVQPAELAAFVRVAPEEFERPFDFNDDLSHFKWAWATAESYRHIGLYLWQHDHPDLLMVYVEGVDTSSHLFGHLFRGKGFAGELAAQQKRFGQTVEAMYVYADQLVGSFLEAMDPDTTLVVLSDHGFSLGELPDDPSKTRDMRRVSAHYHRIEGVLYLYGNGIRLQASLDKPRILDVTPTLLALAGLAPARDMPGRVLSEALERPVPERSLDSYDPDPPTAAANPATDERIDPAILQQLEALGYIDADSPRGDRNIASILFDDGRYREATQAYRKLLKKNPGDASLHASLAGALGALGQYDEALTECSKAIELDPLNPGGYHNRGVIHERRGETSAAIDEYRTALRYRPGYEPSRLALRRLTGSGRMNEPQTPARKLAAQLAEKASQAARRGDYAAASRQLDEAQRIAPHYALVYQYRSNVAYLKGDADAAIAALGQALEIEPDNVLYRTNLERLRAAKPTP